MRRKLVDNPANRFVVIAACVPPVLTADLAGHAVRLCFQAQRVTQ